MEALFLNFWTLLSGYIVPFLFVLTVVVFVHEMGHYLVGRWCGIGVQAFAIGFGPELFGFNDKNGTRWKLCLIPLGGYVKFVGDSSEASTPDHADMAEMSDAEKAVSFHHKSVGKRALTVVAGPVANFLLAIALFFGTVYISGRHVLPPKIDTVQAGSVAEKAGFLAGDLIVSVDAKPIRTFQEIQKIVNIKAGEPLQFVVERKGADITLTVTPELKELKTTLGKQRIGLIGLSASKDPSDWKHETYGAAESLKIAVSDTWNVVDRTLDYLGKVITRQESVEQLSGPLRIAQASGHFASAGFSALIGLTALLSVSIGLINLFPIPMLDGGHLVFYAAEAIRGKPLGERTQEWGFRMGVAFILMIMLVSTWNDLVHLGSVFGIGKS
jgi:regulator of sigma E protease